VAAGTSTFRGAGTSYKGSIQSTIQANVDSYSPSMRRIADVILARPQVVLENTITELARACDTSETSVVRFCRTLGFPGFAPMKLQLAVELATESAQFGFDAEHGSDIRPSDSLSEMVWKVASAETLGIQETAERLDLEALQQVIGRVDRAGKALLYGVGASNASAQDLAEKLLRIGTTAIGFQDAHSAVVSAALATSEDVAIAFSHSGRTRETVAFLRAAQERGCFTVAITNMSRSPLAQTADQVLSTAVRETTFRSGAMASRIAQLTLVDYLFVGVAQGRYEKSVEALKHTYESLGALRDDR
jgi:DNA-binding MurR/RpiR family transcriptional regulator